MQEMTVINVTRRPHQIRQDNAPVMTGKIINHPLSLLTITWICPAEPVYPLRQIRCRGYGKLLRYAVTALPGFIFPDNCIRKIPPLLRNDLFCTIHEISYSSAIRVHTPVSPSDRARRHAPGHCHHRQRFFFAESLRQIPAVSSCAQAQRSECGEYLPVSPYAKSGCASISLPV